MNYGAGYYLLLAWDSTWIAFLAAATLFGAYRALEWRWPERYIGITQTFGLSTQETWLRFALYRALPTYAIAATCFVTVDRLGGYLWISGSVIWIFSVGVSHVRVAVEGALRRWGEANYGGFHIAMALSLSVVIIGAALSRQAWGQVVPPPDELLSAVWSGVVVAGLGGALIFAIRPRTPDSPAYNARYLVDRAGRDVGIDLFDWLFAECTRTGADPILLKSLLVVEAAQRPRWFRNLERLGVRLRLATTSGVMQMASTKPLTDRESVSMAAELYASKWSITQTGESPYRHWTSDLGRSWSVLTAHNADARFATSVSSVADFLMRDGASAFYFSENYKTAIIELRRYPRLFALRGVSSANHLLTFSIDPAKDVKFLGALEPPRGDHEGWWSWEQTFDPTATDVLILEGPPPLAIRVHLSGGSIDSIRPLRYDTYHDAPEPEETENEPGRAEDEMSRSGPAAKQTTQIEPNPGNSLFTADLDPARATVLGKPGPTRAQSPEPTTDSAEGTLTDTPDAAAAAIGEPMPPSHLRASEDDVEEHDGRLRKTADHGSGLVESAPNPPSHDPATDNGSR